MQKHFLFVSIFEHVTLQLMKNIPIFFYHNPNYYASPMIFQTCKIAIEGMFIHLDDSFYYAFTQI
jgi:hypothetical protein